MHELSLSTYKPTCVDEQPLKLKMDGHSKHQRNSHKHGGGGTALHVSDSAMGRRADGRIAMAEGSLYLSKHQRTVL